jgi:cyclopropane-fatty-acyl-phospholipid synthase
MPFPEFESSPAAYRADFIFYGATLLALAAVLATAAPWTPWSTAGLVLTGYVLWTLLEVLLHRFVLNRVQPSRVVHERHHQRPQARRGTPTVVSAPLFALLIFLPALGLLGLWPALALTLGVLGGYLTDAITHPICHHFYGTGPWFKRRLRWHSRHHAQFQSPGCCGVSHSIWDEAFGTAPALLTPAGANPRRSS